MKATDLRSGTAYMQCLENIGKRIKADREAGEPVSDYVILHRNGKYRSITTRLRESSKRGRAGWKAVVVVTAGGELRTPGRALD